MKLFSRLVGLLLLSMGAVWAQSPVTVAVSTQSPGAAIPSDFLGLSFETGNLKTNAAGVNGYMFDSTNTQLVALFTNLGIQNLRIGGTSVDTNNGVILQYTPTNQDIDALFRFAKAAGVKVIFSLRLENGNPAVDAAIAGYTWSNYNQYLTAFAIGNEPDAYGTGDPQITNFSSYLAKWTTFATAITNAVPGAKFGGPDGAGTSYVPGFANGEIGSPMVTWIFSHFYVGGSSIGLTPQQIIAGMLSSSWDTSSDPSHFNATQAVANEDGFPFRSTEFNSYVAGYPGVAGGNNTFASALYAVDSAHWQAAHGCNGVNFHTFLGKYNATVTYDANGNYQIFPIGYGIKAYDVGSHGSNMPLALTNAAGLNLTAYAVGSGANLYVTIVNKENGTNARDASVTILTPGFVAGSVQAMYLTAPGGVGATNNVTLGGAFITNNAPWLGQWTALGSLANSQCVVTVSNSSAAIIKIQAATIFAPPVIASDLPARVRLTAGASFTYAIAVTGAAPFDYQWYQNSATIPGATNASYLATAGAVGSTASYSVIVTNSYGAVTSVVSTLSVVTIPQVTDYYGRQILSYGPVGYWPLQETTAAAPGNWETNYGTLGALGNAYYACTSAGQAAFNQPGAIAGDPDPCVIFSGSASNPNSFAFVPRLTPALTLQAPFTLEAWVNMANNGYGVEIGEGGGTGFNGGANYGGFQMGQGLQTAGNQFQMNYYTGAGNAQNEEQETSLLYSLGKWYHYVVTYDGNNSTLYVDGQNIFTATSSYAPDTSSPLGIGGGKWDFGGVGVSRWFDGALDEVAIYTNVLSALQITNHYLAGISPASNYFQTILSNRPLLYYRMDCPFFTNPAPALDPVAANFGTSPVNGFYPAGVVPGGLAGPPIVALGANNVAAPINGVTSCVDAGFDPAFNPTGAQPFTALAWFRTYPADGRTQTIMSHGGVASWSLNLLGNSGTVTWNSGAGLVVSTNILNDSNWHCVAGVYDGTKNYLYVDGVLNSSGPATHGVAGNTTDDILLGGDPDFAAVGSNEQFLAGAIAEAAFFASALTPAQVQSIYQAGIQPPPPMMLAIRNASGGQLQLSWNYGTLQSSTNAAGPYSDRPGAASPLTVTPANAQEFYRARGSW